MATEEYSIGYDAGYQDGWNAAIDEKPKQEQNFCSRCGKRTSDLNDIHTCTPPKQEQGERLELIGHADLAINNIYIFNGYGEDVPEGRTPIYAGYKSAHGIKE